MAEPKQTPIGVSGPPRKFWRPPPEVTYDIPYDLPLHGGDSNVPEDQQVQGWQPPADRK